MVAAATGVWSSFRKRVAGGKASSESRGSARTTQVVDSPGAKVVEDAPGALVVQGDVHVHGYTGADIGRIVDERMARTRKEMERTHAKKVEALREEIAAQMDSTWDGQSLREVQAALSAGDLDRAETMLEKIEERQLARTSIPAAQEHVRILNWRIAAAMLNGRAEKARQHVEEAVAVIASVDPGSELEFRNASALGIQEFGGQGIIEAIALYKLNLEQLDRDELPGEWAETQYNLGNALLQHGMHLADGLACIDEAIMALRKALEVATRATDPYNWVQAQVSLSGALIAAALRRGGNASLRHLAEAVDTCQEALTEVIREEDPEGWAGVQSNLVVALATQGDRRGGEEGAELLGKAVEVCRELVDARTREGNRLEWAQAQSKLAATLGQRARHVPKREAVKCIELAVRVSADALAVYSRRRTPLEWARTQRNLGTVLKDLGELLGGAPGLDCAVKALAALRSALEVYDRSEAPLQRAGIQQGLGAALLLEAQLRGREDGLDALSDAATACREGLVLAHGSGERWLTAGLHHNSGAIWAQMAAWNGDLEAATKAVSSFRDEIDAYDRSTEPALWAEAQRSVAVALKLEGDLDQANALEKYRDALQHVDAAIQKLGEETLRGRGARTRQLRQKLIAKLNRATG